MKNGRRKCETPYCRKTPAKYRRKCPTCRSREYRRKNPWNYFYLRLKNSAERRDIDFDLSLEEFRDLWERHPEKWEEKVSGVHGMSGSTWTVDRIRPEEGYHADNVQILSLRRNVYKWVEHGRFRMRVFWRKMNKNQKIEEAPF